MQFSIFKSVIFMRHVCTVCESTSLYSFLVMLYTTRLLKSNKKSICVCENYKPIMQNANKQKLSTFMCLPCLTCRDSLGLFGHFQHGLLGSERWSMFLSSELVWIWFSIQCFYLLILMTNNNCLLVWIVIWNQNRPIFCIEPISVISSWSTTLITINVGCAMQMVQLSLSYTQIRKKYKK